MSNESTPTPEDQHQQDTINAIVGDLSQQIAEQARTIAVTRTTAGQHLAAAQHWSKVAAERTAQVEALTEENEALKAEVAALAPSAKRSGSPAKKAVAKKSATAKPRS